MTDSKTPEKKTLSLGGTLSLGSGGAKGGAGVAVEVRKRRFGTGQPVAAATTPKANKPGPNKPGMMTGQAVNDEMARRMQALEASRQNQGETQQRREAELRRAAQLQSDQVSKIEEQRRKEEAEKARIAALEAAKSAGTPVATTNPDAARKTLSLGDEFKKKAAAGKSTDKDPGKKRGRNAYMEELEQRYRTMPGRKKGRDRDGAEGSFGAAQFAEKVIRDVEIPDVITVQELANRMAEKGADVVKKMMLMGELVTLTQSIDQETAILIVEEFGHKYHTVSESAVEEGLVADADAEKDLQPRPPVVTVMGHVDHGKTTLLDSLRKTSVVKGESGGITQHIGAYQVEVPSGKKITFLDTPGHAAFTEMRARGAQLTDIVILVVAADDGVMPQTREAIQHAKAAGVPIVVAINKMDKPDATPDRVKQELLSEELVLEDFGGDVASVPVSALKGTGLDALEEIVLLQAELLDLKANPTRRADGVVVEAKLDKGRGSVATVVVQRGTLKTGDILVAGSVWGRVRALVDDRGTILKHAGPSMPVEVLGLQGVPAAGDNFVVVEDDKRAREVAEYREQKQREKSQASRKLSLDSMFDRMAAEGRMELNVIVKGDVQGSVEAITGALHQLSMEQVNVKVISGGVGVITETDVNLALASDAFVVGFHVRADATARKLAEQEQVELRYYTVIYELIDDVKNAMAGLLAPDVEEEALGAAEVRALFKISKTTIAGCMVTNGVMQRGAKCRLLRDGRVVYTGGIASIRREKDDAKEVKSGFECGVVLEKYEDIKEGDTIECFSLKEVHKTFADLEKLAAQQAQEQAKDRAKERAQAAKESVQ